MKTDLRSETLHKITQAVMKGDFRMCDLQESYDLGYITYEDYDYLIPYTNEKRDKK